MPLYLGSDILSIRQLGSKHDATTFLNVHISRHCVTSLEIWIFQTLSLLMAISTILELVSLYLFNLFSLRVKGSVDRRVRTCVYSHYFAHFRCRDIRYFSHNLGPQTNYLLSPNINIIYVKLVTMCREQQYRKVWLNHADLLHKPIQIKYFAVTT